MRSLPLEVTTACNFSCLHCSREKNTSRREMALPFFQRLLDEGKKLGIDSVSITGGEPLLWTYFPEAFRLCTGAGLRLGMVTNAWEFESRLWPLISDHAIPAQNLDLCFSLDGLNEQTHDEFRQQQGSFKRVLSALNLCRQKGIRASIKCCLWKKNLGQVLDIAVLGRTYGAVVSFIFLTPTPTLISKKIMPDPVEYEQTLSLLQEKIIPLLGDVHIEGVVNWNTPVPLCNPFWSLPNIDPDGNLTFCCNLSNAETANELAHGQDYLGRLFDISLEEGIRRHVRKLESFVAQQMPIADSTWKRGCSACLKRFGKLSWLKLTASPWTREL
jgi:MoaA/NifB/PqqE/SkfB family radical SAM enzyme